MDKKYKITLAVVIITALIIGMLVYIFYSKPKPVVTQMQTISYLVSSEDSLKYCNGADMDSVGFKNTITVVKSTTSPATDLTQAQLIKATIDAATTGMCKEVMDTLDITVENGTAYIPPFGAWAGVSITMCSCQPLVEANLLRLPGITNVAWGVPLPTSIASFDSGVQGTVTLGPTCPVMRVGDTACADKPYATDIQVIAVGSPKSSLFDAVKSDAFGKYKVMLPPGNYSLQPVGGTVLPRCKTKDITIEPSKIITVDLSCDSGIR